MTGRLAPLWRLLLLLLLPAATALPTQEQRRPPLVVRDTANEFTISPSIASFVPDCARPCFLDFLAANYHVRDCGARPDVACLCSTAALSDERANDGVSQCLTTGVSAGFCSEEDVSMAAITKAVNMCRAYTLTHKADDLVKTKIATTNTTNIPPPTETGGDTTTSKEEDPPLVSADNNTANTTAGDDAAPKEKAVTSLNSNQIAGLCAGLGGAFLLALALILCGRYQRREMESKIEKRAYRKKRGGETPSRFSFFQSFGSHRVHKGYSLENGSTASLYPSHWRRNDEELTISSPIQRYPSTVRSFYNGEPQNTPRSIASSRYDLHQAQFSPQRVETPLPEPEQHPITIQRPNMALYATPPFRASFRTTLLWSKIEEQKGELEKLREDQQKQLQEHQRLTMLVNNSNSNSSGSDSDAPAVPKIPSHYKSASSPSTSSPMEIPIMHIQSDDSDTAASYFQRQQSRSQATAPLSPKQKASCSFEDETTLPNQPGPSFKDTMRRRQAATSPRIPTPILVSLSGSHHPNQSLPARPDILRRKTSPNPSSHAKIPLSNGPPSSISQMMYSSTGNFSSSTDPNGTLKKTKSLSAATISSQKPPVRFSRYEMPEHKSPYPPSLPSSATIKMPKSILKNTPALPTPMGLTHMAGRTPPPPLTHRQQMEIRSRSASIGTNPSPYFSHFPYGKEMPQESPMTEFEEDPLPTGTDEQRNQRASLVSLSDGEGTTALRKNRASKWADRALVRSKSQALPRPRRKSNFNNSITAVSGGQPDAAARSEVIWSSDEESSSLPVAHPSSMSASLAKRRRKNGLRPRSIAPKPSTVRDSVITDISVSGDALEADELDHFPIGDDEALIQRRVYQKIQLDREAQQLQMDTSIHDIRTMDIRRNAPPGDTTKATLPPTTNTNIATNVNANVDNLNGSSTEDSDTLRGLTPSPINYSEASTSSTLTANSQNRSPPTEKTIPVMEVTPPSRKSSPSSLLAKRLGAHGASRLAHLQSQQGNKNTPGKGPYPLDDPRQHSAETLVSESHLGTLYC